MSIVSPKLKVIDGHAYATSLDLARHFQKTHDRVLKNIRYTISGLNAVNSDDVEAFNDRSFAPATYRDAKGEPRPMFNLSRDGFALVAMGFTGAKALQWKIKYINAFNEIETQLNARIIRDKHFGQLKFNFPDAGETIEETLPFMTVSYAVARLTELGLMIPPVSRQHIITLIKRRILAGFKNYQGWCIYEESFKRL